MAKLKEIIENLEELLNQGHLEKAGKLYLEAIALSPDNPSLCHNFAILLRKMERPNMAFNNSAIAYKFCPENPTIVFSHGLSSEMVGDLVNAEALYRKALDLRPNYSAALNNLGQLLDQKGRSLEGLECIQKANMISPEDKDITLALANLYLSTGKPKVSLRLLNTYKNPIAFNTRGIAEYVQRNWASAEKYFRKAISFNPNFAGAHENLALTLLHLQKFQSGWEEYLWRWKNGSNTLTKPVFEKPMWTGQNIKNKTLLIHAEQGFGDTFQFIRFVNLVNKKGGRIIFLCQKQLTRLLKRIPYIDQVSNFDDPMPEYDYYIPLLNLVNVLKLSGNNANHLIPYIVSSPIFKPSGGTSMKIGICWAGRLKFVHDSYRNRSCPVELFKSIADLKSVKLFNLQQETKEVEKAAFCNLIATKKLTDFSITADMISSLDLVISVDTSVIHLAGALGIPSIVLLSYAADWRWGTGNGQAPWYPEMLMIRQSAPGDWPGVFDKLIKIIKFEYLK